jgi:hypothetical protein
MKRRSDLIVGSALLAVLFGCGGGGGTSVARVSDVKVPSKSSSCQLTIYQSEADVKQSFEKLCVITSEPSKTVDATYDDLRKAGCKCGADALLITDTRAEGKKAVVTAAAIRFVKATTPAPKN